MVFRKVLTDEQRFWSKVNKNGPVPAHVPELGPCWLWTGSIFSGSKNGYGHFWSEGHDWYAHRLAWTIARGRIESALQVLHRCDNRRCVNPGHLFLGTHQDNMDDMKSKGRQNTVGGESHYTRRRPEVLKHGSSSHLAMLTESDVLEIRSRVASGESQGAVAKAKGIGQGHVSRIVHRLAWAHLE